MKKFLQLNKNKIPATFIRLSLVWLGGVCIVLIIAYLTGNLPQAPLHFLVILGAGPGLPLFIMSIGYVAWLLNHNARQKAFSQIPFNQIEGIGFCNTYLHDSSKWSFTEEIKRGELNGFTLTMNISKEKSHTLEFDIPTKWKQPDKNGFSRLTEKFKPYNIEFRMGSLVKQYNITQPIFQTAHDFKTGSGTGYQIAARRRV